MLSDSTFDKFKYILYKPPDVSSPPLIVVLHGSGEIGNSLSIDTERSFTCNNEFSDIVKIFLS